jgi:isopenicillin-N N-acyltransferase-like protein
VSVAHLEPLLLDQSDPGARGRAHGEHWRPAIRELSAIRVELCRERGAFASDAELFRTAAAHLPVLEAQAPELHAELLGIATGADLSAERVVVLNHYTDLRDVPPAARPGGTPTDAGGCTTIYTHGHDGPVLAQTWDMHASALPFVRMLRVAPADRDHEILCLTLAGCLGMAGMASTGVAVAINNLYSTDGRVGMVWPALVRAMLSCASAADAHALLQHTPLSSGHHYVIADGRDFFGVETSGELKVLTQTGARAAHLHTNHCFDPVLRRREAVPRDNTTFHRLNFATTIYAQQRPATAEALWDLFHTHDAGPGSLCMHGDPGGGDPHATITCAVLSMRLRDGGVRVAHGCAARSEPLDLAVGRWRGGAD